jgi:hypothetical protein
MNVDFSDSKSGNLALKADEKPSIIFLICSC